MYTPILIFASIAAVSAQLGQQNPQIPVGSSAASSTTTCQSMVTSSSSTAAEVNVTPVSLPATIMGSTMTGACGPTITQTFNVVASALPVQATQIVVVTQTVTVTKSVCASTGLASANNGLDPATNGMYGQPATPATSDLTPQVPISNDPTDDCDTPAQSTQNTVGTYNTPDGSTNLGSQSPLSAYNPAAGQPLGATVNSLATGSKNVVDTSNIQILLQQLLTQMNSAAHIVQSMTEQPRQV